MSDAFTPRTTELLDRAASLCEQRGARLTGIRRQVLGLVLETGGPAGAYDLLDRLRVRRGAAAPPTVYRALEFLQEQGLVHRLERLSAFVGCVEEAGHTHRHPVQFLICRRCGQVTEIEDDALAASLDRAAAASGFTVSHATIEAEGLCAGCSAGAATSDCAAR